MKLKFTSLTAVLALAAAVYAADSPRKNEGVSADLATPVAKSRRRCR